jgi:hypothetical protein
MLQALQVVGTMTQNEASFEAGTSVHLWWHIAMATIIMV